MILPKNLNKDLLYDLYFNKNMKYSQIGSFLNCSISVISKYMKRYGFIPRKNFVPWNKGLNTSHPSVKQYTEKRTEVLKDRYSKGNLIIWNKGLSKDTDDSVWKYSQSIKEQIALSGSRKGKNHPFWGKHHTKEGKRNISLGHGGTGIPYENRKYPPEFYEIRRSIIERDGYVCLNCGMTEEEHLIVYGMELHVHHIDYNKQNCYKSNLIASCLPCNTRFNYNKSYWQPLLTTKVVTITHH